MRVYRIRLGNHYLDMGIEIPEHAFTGKFGTFLDTTIEDVLRPILEGLLKVVSGWVVLIISDQETDDRRIFKLTGCIEEVAQISPKNSR